MLKIENLNVYGWEPTIRGMRNPMNSWDLSDTDWSLSGMQSINGLLVPTIGPNDLTLMEKLSKAGNDHAKYLRYLTVTVDVTAPLYWWKEYDTYKVGTVANSCSTMHKIHAKEFVMEDFSYQKLKDRAYHVLEITIEELNALREEFLETKAKSAWYQMIQLLPTSYNQRRTLQFNYQVCQNIYYSRRNHKLDEWHTLCDMIESLPYAKQTILTKEGNHA